MPRLKRILNKMITCVNPVKNARARIVHRFWPINLRAFNEKNTAYDGP